MKRYFWVAICILIALVVVSCDDHVHTYSDEWTYDKDYHWHAATCEHKDAVKEKAEHKWDEGKITTPATEDKAGVKTYTCTVCKKATKTEEISFCEKHTMVEHEAKAATCTEKGWEAYEVCSVCGYSTYKEIAALGHDMGDWSDVADNETERTRKCKRENCSYSETVAVMTGTGSEADPYVIATPNGLKALASRVNGSKGGNDADNFSGKFINLIQDIDLSGIDNWTPIGLYEYEDGKDALKRFSGTFDGQNHEIKNMKIAYESPASSYRALFGYVDGTVKNFTVRGEVSACDSSGVVAALENGGKIENVTSYVNVTVKASYEEKGQVRAKAAGFVVGIKNKNKVTNPSYTISSCKNYGNITVEATDARDCLGGIVAYSAFQNLTIENCENHGTISTKSSGQRVGGIIGLLQKAESSTTVKGCENTGTVEGATGGTKVGDIIGAVEDQAYGTMTNCTTRASKEAIGKNDSGNFKTSDGAQT